MTSWPTGSTARRKRRVRWLLVPLALGTFVMLAPIVVPISALVVYGLMPGVETHITADVRAAGRVVEVSGEANVPDGAVIAFSVSRQDNDDIRTADGMATVRNGRFAFEADVSSLPPGRSAVWMGFGMGLGLDEPLSVVLTYGPYGERLAGDQVWSDSGGKQVELTVPIDVGG